MTWHDVDSSRSPGLKQYTESVVDDVEDAMVTTVCGIRRPFWSLLTPFTAAHIYGKVVVRDGLMYNAPLRQSTSGSQRCGNCKRDRRN